MNKNTIQSLADSMKAGLNGRPAGRLQGMFGKEPCILAPVVGTIGCMMATEAIKLLLGLATELNGKVWIYDGLAGSSRTLAIPRRKDCPVCAAS